MITQMIKMECLSAKGQWYKYVEDAGAEHDGEF